MPISTEQNRAGVFLTSRPGVYTLGKQALAEAAGGSGESLLYLVAAAAALPLVPAAPPVARGPLSER